MTSVILRFTLVVSLCVAIMHTGSPPRDKDDNASARLKAFTRFAKIDPKLAKLLAAKYENSQHTETKSYPEELANEDAGTTEEAGDVQEEWATQETVTTEEDGTVKEAEPIEEDGAVQEEWASEEAETVKEAEPIEEDGSVQEEWASEETGTVKEAEHTEEDGAVQEEAGTT